MLRVRDVVLHQKTGQSGIVIGYGHQILDGVYLPTLIVQLAEKGHQKRFVEELSSEWMLLEREQYSRIA